LRSSRRPPSKWWPGMPSCASSAARANVAEDLAGREEVERALGGFLRQALEALGRGLAGDQCRHEQGEKKGNADHG
jgi:hypothetical protein